MPSHQSLISTERIERAILMIRGQRVLLDEDLASLYGVETRILVRNVKRNLDRFPDDFMFQLTQDEWLALRSQLGILKGGRGKHRKYLPYVFTEQGVAMLSSVLHSPRAIQVNVEIMRTFVRLRRMLAADADLARRLVDIERKYDAQFKVVFDAIRQLMAPPPEPARKRRFGFHMDPEPE